MKTNKNNLMPTDQNLMPTDQNLTPTDRIYQAVMQIPYGKVATYGQIAEFAGNRRMARAVGNALHHNPSPDTIPCYRVVNAKGELAGHFAFGGVQGQAARLRAEGVEVEEGRVNLQTYGWQRDVSI